MDCSKKKKNCKGQQRKRQQNIIILFSSSCLFIYFSFGLKLERNITIHNNQYILASPIAFSTNNGGEIVGRLTNDNNTLVLAYSSIQPSNSSITYCAIQLPIDEMQLTMLGTPSTMVGVDETLRVYPDQTDTSRFSDLIPRDSNTPPLPLPPFATHWLRGLGWDDQPVLSPIVGILEQFNIGTGSDDGSSPTTLFLEHFILAMFANGISLSFSDLNIDICAFVLSSRRRFQTALL